MSRSERWNTSGEIKRAFKDADDMAASAGPIVYCENGKKYVDDSESHICVIGRTGKGKSQCCSLPFMRQILEKGESLVMLDPKGEGYRTNACYIPSNYQVYCLDFRHPRSEKTARWNPLTAPYTLLQSDNPADHDIASSMLSELWNGVYPYDGRSDKFWTDSAINYAKGLTYALFETATENEINLDSIAIMMEQSEERHATSTLLQTLYQTLPSNSLAKRNLSTYVSGPSETRASIHSVAASGIEIFSRSRGLMEMLSEDDLNILNLDVDRPFAIIVITPEETDVYSQLSGILVSQISQHLIRIAQERGGRLPLRVSFILEELGSVGKSIPSLPFLLVASRSRNIRLMLVLQSGESQLVDIYGKSRAETIISCIGLTIGFSTNSWKTLTEWSQRCGEKSIEHGGRLIKEPLITASQLAAMPTGTALVTIENQYKFISRMLFYYEMYDLSDWKETSPTIYKRKKKYNPLDFNALVLSRKESSSTTKTDQNNKTRPPLSSPSLMGSVLSTDPEINAINKRLAELDAMQKELEIVFEEEDDEDDDTDGEIDDFINKREVRSRHHIRLLCVTGNKRLIARAIANATGKSFVECVKSLNYLPQEYVFDSLDDANELKKHITEAGGIVAHKLSTYYPDEED